ncbi:MAG TPA: tRNA dihydrouridine(20/20a) synthase DusA, partial [Steroidobacteraceae bacterium]|nr:tRNA dihydrouridine(20/20a) synthase DusA [Steroidobacteraceae bacterium]
VAPMMDWTDRHCRYFLRGFSPRVLLYTEMVTAAAIVRGDRERLLRHSPEEHPLALQLGGSDPEQLAVAARIGAESGYVEINLNCGCPSDRVHAGAFGACLMREPERVAECVAAMRAAVAARIPVTVKMRIGVLDADERAAVSVFGELEYGKLLQFVRAVQGAGCRHFIVHARQAVLGGLSPRENREVPPLRYAVVERLKQDFPSLWIGVNGGLRQIEQCRAALAWADGLMLGREAYHRPQVLGELHAELHPDGWRMPPLDALLERMADYAARESALGTPLRAITRHMLGLASGRPGARRYRQLLAQPPARFPLREAVEALGAETLGAGTREAGKGDTATLDFGALGAD